MIVVDSNLIAYFLIPGDKNAIADVAFQYDSHWIAPLLWRSEFRNILSLYMRTQKMSLSQAQQTMARAERLMGQEEFAVPSDAVLEMTSKTKLSAYDAEFVVLAQQLKVKLFTFDQGILKAVPKIALTPKNLALEASRRLAKLGGTEKSLRPISRWRSSKSKKKSR